MKRSEINALQQQAVDFFDQHHFYLPPWARWGRDDWQQHRQAAGEIFANKLGWDLTDFGSGDFYHIGLLLFTIRNGAVGDQQGKDYAEKVMIVRERQVTPWHFHWSKMEDIINRGGGNLVIALANATPEEKLAETVVRVQVDGITREVPARGTVVLHPGESISLPAWLYHEFYGEAGKGDVLVGEVSRVNDDARDNRFLQPTGRFPVIDEDAAPLYYLCNEYPV